MTEQKTDMAPTMETTSNATIIAHRAVVLTSNGVLQVRNRLRTDIPRNGNLQIYQTGNQKNHEFRVYFPAHQ